MKTLLGDEFLDFAAMQATEISATLKQHALALSPEEALILQRNILKRAPTLAECVLWGIQGSEHCSYRSTRPYLKSFVTHSPDVILGPREDAGVIALASDKHGVRYGVAMSHESHNHPSQVVPYEGAATGIGGNVRDIACMGAEVIAVADSLRFGSLDESRTHWIQQGVVSGIAGYGNPLGVPNLAGDVFYDAAYNDNCLVTVVALGLVKEDELIHSYVPDDGAGYDLILVGKPTDNSGFGGASFASLELDESQSNKGAVQEPNAFLGRHLLKAHYALFGKLKEKKLIEKVGFKDLGAGGIACASVELAEGNGFGAEVYLDQVPTAVANLAPYVCLCAETQERYLWAVPPTLSAEILHHYNEVFALPQVSYGASAAVIGKVTADKQYRVFFKEHCLVDAVAAAVTQGIISERPIVKPQRKAKKAEIALPGDYNSVLEKLLAHEAIASRAPIFEMYDKQVQGRTLVESGVADAGVMQPFNDDSYPQEIRQVGLALTVDHNPLLNKIDPYWGAAFAVFEAARNVACVGAEPIALTDCLCYGNPEKPEQMWEFAEGVRGISDAAKHLFLKRHPDACVPVIAGNVSLYNETQGKAIPASPIIGCLGRLDNVERRVTFDFKSENSALILVGERQAACGASIYYALHDHLGNDLPVLDFKKANAEIQALLTAIDNGWVLAAHDIAEGGLAVAIAEMSFAKQIGALVEMPETVRLDSLLFGEAPGFILEVPFTAVDAVQLCFEERGASAQLIGQTTPDKRLQLQGCVDLSIVFAKHAWQEGLRQRLAGEKTAWQKSHIKQQVLM